MFVSTPLGIRTSDSPLPGSLGGLEKMVVLLPKLIESIIALAESLKIRRSPSLLSVFPIDESFRIILTALAGIPVLDRGWLQ